MSIHVSVAMCTYNGVPYVVDQVSSILSQTRGVDELVVGDDGSTDDTVSTIESLMRESSADLRLLSATDRLGPAANFSRTLEETSGELVFLADQDDVWRQTRVEVVTDCLEAAPEALAVAQDPDLVDHHGAPLGSSLFDSMRVTAGELDQLNGPRAIGVAVRRNFIPGMALTVRRALLDRCLPVPPSWMHDYWLVACAAALGRLRVEPSRSMLDYRQHSDNAIGAGSQSLVTRARRLLAVPNEPDLLARMFSELAEWMEQQTDISDLARDTVSGKVEMESRRAEFSPHGWSRGRAALRMLADGSYTTYASNGRLNVLRDLVHAPSTRKDPPRGR